MTCCTKVINITNKRYSIPYYLNVQHYLSTPQIMRGKHLSCLCGEQFSVWLIMFIKDATCIPMIFNWSGYTDFPIITAISCLKSKNLSMIFKNYMTINSSRCLLIWSLLKYRWYAYQLYAVENLIHHQENEGVSRPWIC